MAKAEVISLMHLARVEMFLENVMRKLVRSHERKIARKRQQQNRVQLGGLQQPKFSRGWRQQFESVVGTKNARRMRIESHHHRDRAGGASAAHDLSDDGAVSAVNPVEVADAHNRRTEVRRNVRELMKDAHRDFFTAETPRSPRKD